MTQSTPIKALLVCLAQAGSVFFVHSAVAQNTSEVGIGLGGLSYKGELSPRYQFRNNRPAFTAFYRKDISAPVTLRGAITGGLLRAADETVKGVNNDTAPLAAYRNANLKGSLWEVSGALEYNFFDFHNRKDKVHFTPYVFVGIAGFYAHTRVIGRGIANSEYNSLVGVAIPAGLGFKYALSQHWNLGLEAGARKTFTDNIDRYNGKDLPTASSDVRVLGNPNDKDWYFYNGLSISYTFYKIRCPEGTLDIQKNKKNR
ncbi:DUF6089 family protein [Hymenobacter wooponensis]|uniref:Porin family protein n=1 Tax=Hymenobacter wooponensis TaxID=1525360 RepID=A0A4Z0MFL9_9BACT|nr:DUF6089 family protein [Hymenobacter wooponensis]TGD78314.1 porin family protein [Hymenobacter wooponensis]